MVAALDSKSSLERGGSSSLPPGTKKITLVIFVHGGESSSRAFVET